MIADYAGIHSSDL